MAARRIGSLILARPCPRKARNPDCLGAHGNGFVGRRLAGEASDHGNAVSIHPQSQRDFLLIGLLHLLLLQWPKKNHAILCNALQTRFVRRTRDSHACNTAKTHAKTHVELIVWERAHDLKCVVDQIVDVNTIRQSAVAAVCWLLNNRSVNRPRKLSGAPSLCTKQTQQNHLYDSLHSYEQGRAANMARGLLVQQHCDFGALASAYWALRLPT
jgi:hypothetical protein